MEENKIKEL